MKCPDQAGLGVLPRWRSWGPIGVRGDENILKVGNGDAGTTLIRNVLQVAKFHTLNGRNFGMGILSYKVVFNKTSKRRALQEIRPTPSAVSPRVHVVTTPAQALLGGRDLSWEGEPGERRPAGRRHCPLTQGTEQEVGVCRGDVRATRARWGLPNWHHLHGTGPHLCS